jgi:CheY-specific phosphatase CheX
MFDIKNGIITLDYDGQISDEKNISFSHTIKKQIDSTGKDKIKALFVSLKKITFKDPKELALLIKHLDNDSKKLGITIGLYNYSQKVYKIAKIIAKKTSIELFNNLDTIRLFMNPKAFKKGLSVLIFDENKEDEGNLAHELSSLGYAVTKAKDETNFKQLLESKNYKFSVTQSFLGQKSSKTQESKPRLKLSKNLIINLPVFMDTAVETLVTFTGLKAQKLSHSITSFNSELVSDVVCAIMKFKGDLSGSFVLVFPRATAVKALEEILGEKINTDDTDTITDGVKEFCNTITGSTKTYLSKKSIKILFELPRSYTSIKQVNNIISDHNGIWINMQLDQKPFYMFITN